MGNKTSIEHMKAEIDLLNYLLANAEKPVKSIDIVNRFGFKRRELQYIIRTIRKEGHPVIGGDFGYMYTFDVQLLNRFVAKLSSAATDMLNTANIIRGCIRSIERMEKGEDGTLFE
jgi:hypothetical protein